MQATKPLWADPHSEPVLRPLETDLDVDVAIVGGGVTGLTAALLLKRSGRRVAVFEARQLLEGVTGSTTAHLTQIIDTRYHEIESKFGREGAALVARSNADALNVIQRIVEEMHLRCDFERVPGFLYAETDAQQAELTKELEAAIRAGVPAAAQALPPGLPFEVKGSMRVDHQAQLDPRAYLVPIALEVNSGGSFVFERTPITAIHDASLCRLETGTGHTVTAQQVIVATHSPLNLLLLQTKIAHYQSYVVSGPVADRPAALLWDMGDPYHYIRTQRTKDGLQLIIGGEDHKTGQDPNPEAAFDRLTEYAKRFHMVPNRRWSAQVVEPVDGLPFIGRNSGSNQVFVATGYSGNGMTFGTVAAMLITDAILGRPNVAESLYAATRIKPLASLKSYLQENIDFPLYLVGGALKPAEAQSLDEVHPNEGKIVSHDGKRIAVFRDAQSKLHAVSPLCTHMGCHVAFNSAQTSWDCPCHGSRFSVDGDVLDGPAIAPLAPIDLTPAEKKS